MIVKPHCLKCEKELTFGSDCGNIDDAGYMTVEFHYGSRHDMCIGFREHKGITTFICDDCYEQHRWLFHLATDVRETEKEARS